ncbi:hypothetical protein GCM10018771_14320 [Streptomyces cellulosae]|nr:hypothetical protein GCM10018771_14320 [Streptomyces cellulosae]
MRGCGAVGVARAHAAEPHMSQPRAPGGAALVRHRNKGRISSTTPSGDCARLPGSRMVTLIYPRLPVVHP